ncbi:MAG: class I SAM-dependent methyltransferase [Actinomycetota bacterium]
MSNGLARAARRTGGRVKRGARGILAAGSLGSRVDQLAARIDRLDQQRGLASDVNPRLRELGVLDALSHDPDSYARWLTWRPPGHFYSAIPSVHDLGQRLDALWPAARPERVAGIDLNAEVQLDTFRRVAEFGRELTLPASRSESSRYYSDNVSYGPGDALTLHGMLRHARPERLIEIGSGFSSAMTMDTVEQFLDGKTQLTFIEPYPELLESLMRPGDEDRVAVIAKPLQSVPLDVFSMLEAGDVLFVDSTHVVKTGSDVVWLYGEVLPIVKPGVYVHIHDIFHPFEYPKEWVLEGRAWSEAYLVRAFLTCNEDFEILLFNDWLAKFHRDAISAHLPRMLDNTGGALWLRRVGRAG